MLTPWLNITIKVQRRSGTTRNALNEPDWGDESAYPVVYASIYARIEVVDRNMQYTETGERVTETKTLLFFEPTYTILPEDRITVLSSNNSNIQNQLFLVYDVVPEWDSIGNVHHFVAELQVH